MTLTRLTTDSVALLPSRQPERTKAMYACRRIAHVKIAESVKFQGTTYYKMQLFFAKPTSNIPTRQRFEPKGWDDKTPDIVVLQRFSAFASLSHELNYHAQEAHPFQLCGFCQPLTCTLRRNRPRIRTKLFGGDATMHVQLERYINSALALVQTSLDTSPRNYCDGQQETPILLARFLSGKLDSANYSSDCNEQPKPGLSSGLNT